MKSTTFANAIVIAAVALTGLLGFVPRPALAQEESGEPAAEPSEAGMEAAEPAAAEPAAAEPAAAPSANGGPYRAPEELKARCTEEMAKDALWGGTVRAEIRREYEDEWQEANARRLTNDNQYVVWAYSILWIIIAGFVVFVFTRQRRLVDEIERLRADVEAASAE